MVTKDEIIFQLTRAKAFYSDLFNTKIEGGKYGIQACNEGTIEPLFHIIKALQIRIDQNLIDEKTQMLYNCLIRIIGSGDADMVNVYYGWLDTKVVLDPIQIEAGEVKSVIGQLNYTLDFTTNRSLMYLWFAELVTEPIKVRWQDTVLIFNNGKIGSDQDLFGPTVISGNYRFYITEYKTLMQNPIILEK